MVAYLILCLIVLGCLSCTLNMHLVPSVLSSLALTLFSVARLFLITVNTVARIIATTLSGLLFSLTTRLRPLGLHSHWHRLNKLLRRTSRRAQDDLESQLVLPASPQIRPEAFLSVVDENHILRDQVHASWHANKTMRLCLRYSEENGESARDEVLKAKEALAHEREARREERARLLCDNEAAYRALAEAQAQSAIAEVKYKDLEEECAALRERCSRGDSVITTMKRDITDYENGAKQLRSAIHNQCTTIYDHREREERLTVQNAALKAKVGKLQLARSAADSELRAVRAELAATRETMHATTDGSEKLRSALESAREAQAATTTECAQLRTALDSARQTLRVVENEREEFRGGVRTLEERQHASEDFTRTLSDALEARDETISQLHAAHVEQGAELAHLKHALAERSAEGASQERKIGELETFIHGLEGVVAFLKHDAHWAATPTGSRSSIVGTPRTPRTPSLSSTPSSSQPYTPELSRDASPTRISSSGPSSPALRPLVLPRRLLWDTAPKASPTRPGPYTLRRPLGLFGF